MTMYCVILPILQNIEIMGDYSNPNYKVEKIESVGIPPKDGAETEDEDKKKEETKEEAQEMVSMSEVVSVYVRYTSQCWRLHTSNNLYSTCM